MFSCEFCQFFKNTFFFIEHFRWLILDYSLLEGYTGITKVLDSVWKVVLIECILILRQKELFTIGLQMVVLINDILNFKTFPLDWTPLQVYCCEFCYNF